MKKLFSVERTMHVLKFESDQPAVTPRRASRVAVLLAALILSTPAPAAEITVSAAASLRDAFTELAGDYERRQPGTRVLLNFGGSGALYQQIRIGAPVDVFAPADDETMDRAVAAGRIDPALRHDFAGNTLVLAVPADARSAPEGLDDLGSWRFGRIAIGQPEAVPAGRYARAALREAGLWEVLSSRLVPAQNVRQALDYVARGEVDAAFVYATDLAARPGRARIAFEVPLPMPIRYPIAPVSGSRQPAVAAAFVRFVLSRDGQQVLRRHGFLSP